MGLLTAYLNRNFSLDKVASNDDMMRYMVGQWSQRTGAPFDGENMSRAAVKRAYRQLQSNNPAFRQMVTSLNESGAAGIGGSAGPTTSGTNRPAPVRPPTPTPPPIIQPEPKLLTTGSRAINEINSKAVKPGSSKLSELAALEKAKAALAAKHAPIRATLDKYYREALTDAGVDVAGLTAEQIKDTYRKRFSPPTPPQHTSAKDLASGRLKATAVSAKPTVASPPAVTPPTPIAGKNIWKGTKATGQHIGRNKGWYTALAGGSMLADAIRANREAANKPVSWPITAVGLPAAAVRRAAGLIGDAYTAVFPKKDTPDIRTKEQRLRDEFQAAK